MVFKRALTAALLVLVVSLQAMAQGSVKISQLTSPVHQGDKATVTAQVPPNANCTVTVKYKSGNSTAKGLGAKAADAKGVVSWTWTVGQKTTPGTYPVTVTATSGAKSDSATGQLQVQAR